MAAFESIYQARRMMFLFFFISGNWRNAHYSDVENYDIKKEQKITG